MPLAAGPAVLAGAKKGERAIVGVLAGAKLGKLKIRARRGYAKPTRRLAEKWLDPKRWARANDGVPIGVGNFGLVRSRNTHGGVPGDLDLDGVPNSLDIDRNGNLILNDYDRNDRGHRESIQGASVQRAW